jgi:hypothetical protein
LQRDFWGPIFLLLFVYTTLISSPTSQEVSYVTYFILKISDQGNSILIADLKEKKVYEAIMQMKKAPGSYGFPTEFFLKNTKTLLKIIRWKC